VRTARKFIDLVREHFQLQAPDIQNSVKFQVSNFKLFGAKELKQIEKNVDFIIRRG